MANTPRVIPTPLGNSNAQIVPGSTTFDRATSDFLSRTPSSDGNEKTFTISWWFKLTERPGTAGAAGQSFFISTSTPSNSENVQIYLSDDTFIVNTRHEGGSWTSTKPARRFRDNSAWYHIVVAIDTTQSTGTDRLKIYINGELNSVWSSDGRANITQNTNLNFCSATEHCINNQGATFNVYGDFNMSQFYILDGAFVDASYFGFTDLLTGTWRPKKYYNYNNYNDGTVWSSNTCSGTPYSGQAFTSAFDGRFDTYVHSQFPGTLKWVPPSTMKGKLRCYLACGARGSSVDNNFDFKINGVSHFNASTFPYNASGWVDFGEVSIESGGDGIEWGVQGGNDWIGMRIIEIDGFRMVDSLDDTGCYLPLDGTGYSAFQTAGNMLQDQSGKQNNWTNNGSPTFQTDSPSGVSNSIDTTAGITTTGFPSNYATLNPLRRFTENCTLSDGNLKATGSSESYPGISANAELTSGKWYYEFVINTKTSNPMCGVCDNNYMSGGSGRVLYRANGYYVTADGSEPTDPDTFGAGDIIGVAINLDDTAGYIRFYKNGALQNVNAGLNALKSDLNVSKARGGLLPYIQMYTSDVCTVNYGQNVFQYTPPDGHRPICTANLNMEGDGISNPSLYSYNTTYTGNGTSNSSLKMVTGVGFQPDFVWIKAVSSTWPHMIFDTVKGKRQTNPGDSFWYSMTDSANSAYQYGSVDQVSEMTPDGFNVQGYSGYSNTDGASYWAWCLKAGGGNMKGSSGNEFWRNDQKYSTAALAGVGGGTITPTACSVGVPQGFSMIQFDGNATNSTVAHGLSKPPEFILIKNGHSPNDWAVYHVGLHDTTPQDYYAEFNTTLIATDDSTYWNDTAPTSSVFSVGTSVNTNTDQAENRSMAWCWHSVPGMQRFGWYYGSSNADGPTVKLGFRPAVIMVKKRDGTENWQLHTTSRNPYNSASNAAGNRFFINLTTAETTQPNLDILSDGFKIKTTDASVNSNNEEYMYCAWAEQSSVSQYGGQATGR